MNESGKTTGVPTKDREGRALCTNLAKNCMPDKSGASLECILPKGMNTDVALSVRISNKPRRSIKVGVQLITRIILDSRAKKLRPNEKRKSLSQKQMMNTSLSLRKRAEGSEFPSLRWTPLHISKQGK